MKRIIKISLILFIGFTIICGLIYLSQEKLIFHPEQLAKNHKFQFDQKFEELNFKTNDNQLLNALLFKSESSKGLIFYLHGNAGSLNSWGEIAEAYLQFDFDVLMLDYRGFGKSEGEISSQSQLFEDIQVVYNEMKKKYPENKIIILGYSIGTGPAAKLASTNNPKLLILQAPYYSLIDMMKQNYPYLPTFLLKYKLETSKYIQDCKMPIIIFHGDRDNVIYYNSSVKLRQLAKPTDTLIILKGQGHNGITDNPDYLFSIEKLLPLH